MIRIQPGEYGLYAAILIFTNCVNSTRTHAFSCSAAVRRVGPVTDRRTAQSVVRRSGPVRAATTSSFSRSVHNRYTVMVTQHHVHQHIWKPRPTPTQRTTDRRNRRTVADQRTHDGTDITTKGIAFFRSLTDCARKRPVSERVRTCVRASRDGVGWLVVAPRARCA